MDPVLELRKKILAKTDRPNQASVRATGGFFALRSIWLVPLKAYGLLVVYFSDVFPLREIGHNVLHGNIESPAMSVPPRGL